jgi:Flp pilus assembly protein TadB
MSVEEELQEKAEEARHPFDRKVAASMAVIAAALAIVAVLGHLTSTEEVLTQQKASDQWAYFQAKSIRRYESDIAREILSAMNDEGARKASAKYAGNAERYQKETEEIQEKANEFEKESRLKGLQAQRLHFGEVFLEIAIVLASLAILTHRKLVWATSITAAALGCAIALTTLLIA